MVKFLRKPHIQRELGPRCAYNSENEHEHLTDTTHGFDDIHAVKHFSLIYDTLLAQRKPVLVKWILPIGISLHSFLNSIENIVICWLIEKYNVILCLNFIFVNRCFELSGEAFVEQHGWYQSLLGKGWFANEGSEVDLLLDHPAVNLDVRNELIDLRILCTCFVLRFHLLCFAFFNFEDQKLRGFLSLNSSLELNYIFSTKIRTENCIWFPYLKICIISIKILFCANFPFVLVTPDFGFLICCCFFNNKAYRKISFNIFDSHLFTIQQWWRYLKEVQHLQFSILNRPFLLKIDKERCTIQKVIVII